MNFQTPIVRDKFYLGVTGRFYEKDGYLKNTYLNSIDNDRKNYFGKLYLRLTPTDRFDISLISNHYELDDGVISQNILTAPNYREYQSDIHGFSKAEFESHSLKITYDFDNFTLESISTYLTKEWDMLVDADFQPSQLLHNRIEFPFETWSEEFRLNGKIGKLK